MSNNWIIFFSAGMVAGGLVGYYICKRKYHIVQVEEVEPAKTGEKSEGSGLLKVSSEEMGEMIEKTESKMYEASYKQYQKGADEEWEEAEKVSPVEPEMVPYCISPDAYANEHNEYAKIVLLYYEDNEVLEYEEYDINAGDDHFADIGSTIGHDAINHFGEYERDAVFVRNERLGNDYEVLLIHSAYDEGED